MADADVAVGWSDFYLESVPVYAFTAAGSYRYEGRGGEGLLMVNHLDEKASRSMAAQIALPAGNDSFPMRPFSVPLAKALLVIGLLCLVLESVAAPRATVGRLS